MCIILFIDEYSLKEQYLVEMEDITLENSRELVII